MNKYLRYQGISGQDKYPMELPRLLLKAAEGYIHTKLWDKMIIWNCNEYQFEDDCLRNTQLDEILVTQWNFNDHI